MATRQVHFDANSLLKLLVHYTESAESVKRVPLDGELVSLKVSAYLQNYIGLIVRSNEWEGRIGKDGVLEPLHIRYEGRRVFTWADRGTPYQWTDDQPSEIAPKRTA